ncbi:hypothetical protein ABBQ32_004461 [Trebouxia sp. C0010 RCD-2024]
MWATRSDQHSSTCLSVPKAAAARERSTTVIQPPLSETANTSTNATGNETEVAVLTEDFNDADSQGTVSDCVFSEDQEVVDVESGDVQSANNHCAVDHDKAVDLDEALGLS